MTEELARLRFAEMEARMNRMTNMVAQMEAFQTNQMAAVMIEESTKARLTRIEMRLDQMTSMLIDIKNLIMASLVDTQVTPLVDLASSKRKSAECSRDQYSPRRNWGITNEMTIVPNPNTCSIQMSKSSDQAWGVPKTQQPKRKKFTPRQYTPLPRPLSKLLPMLLEARLVAKKVPRESPPKFTGFDMNKSCEFYMGEKGHDVNNCLVLKNRVQNLIDRGMLDFKEPEMNVHQNSLPDHQRVNLIEDDDSEDEYEAWIEHRRAADHRFIKEAIANGETIAPLGDSAGNYKFMVKFTPPAWARDPNHVVIPNGWGGIDDLKELDIGMPNNDPVIDTELGTEFQEKLEVTPEVLSEEDIKEESYSSVIKVSGVAEDLLEEADYHSLELPNSSIMSEEILVENSIEPGKGVSENAQGIVKPTISSLQSARRDIEFHGKVASSLSHGMTKGKGHGRNGDRGGRAINPLVWKGNAKGVPFWGIPLSHTFPGPSRMLLEDEAYSEEEEEDLTALYEL